ncbi:MAG: redoxin domain-containing protein [Aureliella sp.]
MSLRGRALQTLFFLAVFASVVCPKGVAAEPSFADTLNRFSLSNNYGKQIALSEYSDTPIIVIAFLGTECPLAKLYGPRLDRLADRFADKGVAILGVCSNKQDSLTELTAYVHRFEIGFPMLKDVGNKLADAMQATRTPEVFVLDQNRQVRYHGRIDDQYGVGYARDKPNKNDLADAIEALVDGKTIAQPETQAVGCVIGRVKTRPATGDVTYTKDIAPILNSRCAECHRDGEIGPFTLTSYEDVLGWEDTILEVIDDRRMPPWNANPKFGHFSNDPRLSEQEIALLRTWVDNGMPQGDPADLPEPPQFVTGWRIPKPDQVLKMSEEAFKVPAEGIVDYQRYVVDPGWDEDKYIYAAEARPQNRQVVHHILVYVIPPGEDRRSLKAILAGYAPGNVPVNYGPNAAMWVPAGSKLLFELHYTPNGRAQTDLSYAGVCFTTKDKVKTLIRGRAVIEHDLNISPGDDNHEVVARPYVSRRTEYLLSMTPHMHLRGKAFRYEAIYPDGSRETLLDVPNYDFNWQLKYELAEPKKLPRGTKIVGTAVYDNSEKNLVNPDPTRTVHWGDQSDEEMMIGFFDVSPTKP